MTEVEQAVQVFSVQKYTQAPKAQYWRAVYMACTFKLLKAILHPCPLHSVAQRLSISGFVDKEGLSIRERRSSYRMWEENGIHGACLRIPQRRHSLWEPKGKGVGLLTMTQWEEIRDTKESWVWTRKWARAHPAFLFAWGGCKICLHHSEH